MPGKLFALLMGVSSLIIPTIAPAIAGSANVFQSPSGDTVFPEAAVGCAGNVVPYSTRYQGVAYHGTLWIHSPQGKACEGGRGRWVNGYFEERNQRSGEWCKGQLTLYLTLNPRGGSSAKWSNIQAVPGYQCSGAGKTTTLPLVAKTVYHD